MVQFDSACENGDESKAKSLLERDPGLRNKKNSDGYTGLMVALRYKNHPLSWWLLSLPGLDTSIDAGEDCTALHLGPSLLIWRPAVHPGHPGQTLQLGDSQQEGHR